MTRPPLGKPQPGDPVIITERGYRQSRDIDATVTKVGRVWVELAETHNVRSQAKTWRLRLDSQDGGPGGYRTYFATPEQHAYDQRARDAYRFLYDQGIELRGSSPWNSPEGRLRLAEIIRTATEPAGEQP